MRACQPIPQDELSKAVKAEIDSSSPYQTRESNLYLLGEQMTKRHIDSKRNRDDSQIDHGTYEHECLYLDDAHFCLFRLE